MRRIVVIVFMLLSSVAFAQFDPNSSLGQQQNEIANTVKAEVEAQARKQQTQAQQSQTLMNRNQTQTTRQQVIESYNNRISNEGQQRMEYYNNPENYINRSVTNRSSSYTNTNNDRQSSSRPTRDLRTQPVHSEELNSKSLQMLREANREYFSSEDRETAIDPQAQVSLFDAPSLDAPLFDAPNLGEKTVEEMDMEAVYAELSPEDRAIYDKRKKEILDRLELAEYQNQIAEYNNFFNDSGFDGARSAVIHNFSQKFEAKKELDKAKKELQELEEWAKETVRNK